MNWFVTKYETYVHKLKLYFALLIAKNEQKYDTMQMITFEISINVNNLFNYECAVFILLELNLPNLIMFIQCQRFFQKEHN